MGDCQDEEDEDSSEDEDYVPGADKTAEAEDRANFAASGGQLILPKRKCVLACCPALHAILRRKKVAAAMTWSVRAMLPLRAASCRRHARIAAAAGNEKEEQEQDEEGAIMQEEEDTGEEPWRTVCSVASNLCAEQGAGKARTQLNATDGSKQVVAPAICRTQVPACAHRVECAQPSADGQEGQDQPTLEFAQQQARACPSSPYTAGTSPTPSLYIASFLHQHLCVGVGGV